MSQGSQPEWWYALVYPGAPERMDAATTAFGRWLQAQAAQITGSRWFFIRYSDETGPHVRLRLRADPDRLDQVHARREELLQMLTRLVAEPVAARAGLVATAWSTPGKDLPAVRYAPYQPELNKYGSGADLLSSEEVFQDSSRLVLDLDVTRGAHETRRAAIALYYLGAMVGELVGTADAERFWIGHLRQWGPALRASTTQQQAQGIVRRLLSSADPGLLAEHERDRITRHVALAADRLQRRTLPTAHLCLHHVHMTLNRMGFHPADEAVLGFVSRGQGRAGHPSPITRLAAATD